jgi:hypothetical protein
MLRKVTPSCGARGGASMTGAATALGGSSSGVIDAGGGGPGASIAPLPRSLRSSTSAARAPPGAAARAEGGAEGKERVERRALGKPAAAAAPAVGVGGGGGGARPFLVGSMGTVPVSALSSDAGGGGAPFICDGGSGSSAASPPLGAPPVAKGFSCHWKPPSLPSPPPAGAAAGGNGGLFRRCFIAV